MKAIYLALSISIWVVSLVFVWLYPLTRIRMKEIRYSLEERRGKV
jgi:Na+/melibiose symporter-like transporter